jgi:hypothetical protein
MRKICKIEALQYFVPSQYNGHWTQMLYTLHIFDHPLYGHPQSYHHSAVIDIDGREIFVEARPGVELTAGDRGQVKQSSQ